MDKDHAGGSGSSGGFQGDACHAPLAGGPQRPGHGDGGGAGLFAGGGLLNPAGVTQIPAFRLTSTDGEGSGEGRADGNDEFASGAADIDCRRGAVAASRGSGAYRSGLVNSCIR